MESDQLVVDWEDGEKSCYPLDWLKKNYSRGDKKVTRAKQLSVTFYIR